MAGRKASSARSPGLATAAHVWVIAAQMRTTAQPAVNPPSEHVPRLSFLHSFGTSRPEVRTLLSPDEATVF